MAFYPSILCSTCDLAGLVEYFGGKWYFSSTIDIAGYFLLASIVAFYLTYFLYLSRYNKQNTLIDDCEQELLPNASLIVPTYNEEKTIEKKLQNILSMRYPKEKLEVIFVDGCSTDSTPQIIQKFIGNEHKFIRLIKQKIRSGYNEGVFDGLSRASNDIIVLTDAGAYYNPDALVYLLRHFKNSKVGAVTGREVVINAKKGAANLESTYRTYYDFMRLAESNLDSTPDLKGEISAIRKEICLSTVDRAKRSNNASFDCCIPYQVRMEGFKVVFDLDAFYYEFAPETFTDRMKQQIRRGSILIASLILYKDMIFNKRYGRFGQIILPAHLLMTMILPWFFILGCMSLLLSFMFNPFHSIIAFLLIIPLTISSRSRIFLLSFVQSQIALIVSLSRVFAKRESLLIDTITSTRQ